MCLKKYVVPSPWRGHGATLCDSLDREVEVDWFCLQRPLSLHFLLMSTRLPQHLPGALCRCTRNVSGYTATQSTGHRCSRLGEAPPKETQFLPSVLKKLLCSVYSFFPPQLWCQNFTIDNSFSTMCKGFGIKLRFKGV